MYVIKAVTYKGPYESNEDAVCFNNNGNIKGAVCDGVGSYANASEAAQYVAKYICSKNNSDLPKMIRECHDYLMSNHEKFGFTTIAAIEQVGEKFVCCNVGDTRIYVIGNKTFTQISEDHTNQKKLEDIYKGFYDVDEAKKMARFFSVLEAALGWYKLDIYTTEYTLEYSDLLIIASDGAWDTSLEKTMKQVSQFLTPRERAEILLEHMEILNKMGRLEDNASLMMIWRE